MLDREFYEKELEKELARRELLSFIQYTWDKTDSYKVGYHTRIICQKADEAIEKFSKGISSFTIISVCYRHGKSEIVSCKLPVYFLSKFQEKEVITTSSTADKALEFSNECRRLVRDNPRYKELFPNVSLAPDARNLKSWKLSNKIGKSQYFGMQSGVAGYGAHFLIIDDCFKNRDEADSPTTSEKVYQEYRFLMTRLPDPYMVFIVVTRYNTYDLVARILEDAENDPEYPKIDYVSLPGVSDQYESGYLFPERFSPEWYKNQKAVLVTEYEYSSLVQQEPVIKGGNLFKVDYIKTINQTEIPKNLQEIITIDLASTEKNRKNMDPDYTVCLKGGMFYKNGQPNMYITDMVRFREKATKRDKLIKDFLLKHGVKVYMEAVAGYKDSYETMKDALMGVLSIVKMPQLSGDKVIKSSPLEAVIEAGNMYIIAAPWNKYLISEVGAFSPSMNHKHDDIVDCLAMLYHVFKKKPRIKNYNRIY